MYMYVVLHVCEVHTFKYKLFLSLSLSLSLSHRGLVNKQGYQCVSKFSHQSNTLTCTCILPINNAYKTATCVLKQISIT